MRNLLIVAGLCLLSVGCFEPQRLRDQAPKTDAAPAPATARPPQVRQESINESNAHAKAEELEAELDFLAQKK
jgi:hypothetical protein